MKPGKLFLNTWIIVTAIIVAIPRNANSMEHRLKPCPDTPNCVSSELTGAPSVAPLSYSGSPASAWKRLRETVETLGGDIQEDTGTYLHAVFTSFLFRFKDDLELRLEPEHQQIHVRSASRVGYSDMGVNRRRVEKVRAAFSQATERNPQ